jgi:hypothetical protein
MKSAKVRVAAAHPAVSTLAAEALLVEFLAQQGSGPQADEAFENAPHQFRLRIIEYQFAAGRKSLSF